MRTLIFFCLFAFMASSVLHSQYNPELDIRGTDDASDGGEMQLATPSENHFLRLFSGHDADPNPFLYFSPNDVFRIATGHGDFLDFTERMTFRGDGTIGINTDDPQTLFHVNGDMTLPWNARLNHYSNAFAPAFQNMTFLNKGWTGDLWDFTYLSSTGNRSNAEQGAIMLTHKHGVLFGKGHDMAAQLTIEHVRIDTSGNVGICTTTPDEKLDVNGNIKSTSLAGTGDRNVVADANGVLKVESPPLKYLSLSGAAFHPGIDNNSITWVAGYSGAYFVTAPANYENMIASVNLPHNSTIHQITVHYTDSDASENVVFILGKYLPASNTFSSLVSLTSSGSAGFQGVTTTTTQPIDNFTEAYYFLMQPDFGSGGGFMDSDFKIHHVLIQYSE